MASNKPTDRECLQAMLHREKPKMVIHLETYPLGFAAIQAGRTIYDAYTYPRFSYESQKKLAAEMGWLFQPAYPGIGGGWGGKSKLRRGDSAQSPIPVRYAVTDEEGVWKLKAPELTSVAGVRKALRFYTQSAQDSVENTAFKVTLNTAGPFTMAAQLCSMDRMGRWILRNPGVVHHLLRLATDHIILGARLWLDTFKDRDVLFYLSEPMSANQIISPRQFEEFAYPYIKEVHEKVLSLGYKHIFCHICGDHNANLPWWSKIPMGDPGIISVGHQIELETAAKYFPRDIIYGNIDPIIIQIGTPQQVYEATVKVVNKGKRIPNGFVFGPGCELTPQASRENIVAMMKGVADSGRYEIPV
jgi:uroporphyrinogen decarboxylase